MKVVIMTLFRVRQVRFAHRVAHCKRHKAAGFTLVELLLALAMLVTEMITLLSLIFGGMVQNETNQEYDIARNAATSKIEEIRGCEFSKVFDRYNNTIFYVPALVDQIDWTKPAQGQVIINNSAAELYDITVTVKWKIKDSITTRADVCNQFVIRSLLARGTRY